MKGKEKSQRVSILILAHNEAKVIERSVSSAATCLTTRDAIYVIADNCTDSTAAIASKAGAHVLARVSPNASGKGKALAWFIDHHYGLIKDNSFVVVLDADSRIKPGFIELIRERVKGSNSAFQCFVVPENHGNTHIGKLAALSELIDQLVSDRIRTSFRWPVRLRGTGMVLKPDHLFRVHDNLQTEVEDIALSLLLSSNGIKIERIDEALVYDPKPETTRAAASQRARWFRGQWAALWQYRGEISRAAIKGPAYWSLLSSLFLKPKWLFFFASLMCALILSRWAWVSFPFWMIIGVGFMYLAWGLIQIPDRKVYARSLVFLPAFAWMWIRGIIFSLHSSSWRRARE